MAFKKTFRFFTSSILCFTLVLFCALFIFEISGYLPGEYNIRLGEEHIISTRFPITIKDHNDQLGILEINRLSKGLRNSQLQLRTIEKGSINLKYNLFGFIPYKTLKVNVVPKLYLYPGGQSIGVRLNTEGVLIVGVSEIIDLEGVRHNPSEEGGVRIGDSLMKINGKTIENKYHIIEILQKNEDKPVELSILRNGRVINTRLTPIKSQDDHLYKIGLWVRDRTAGVGTLTFYHEDSKKFGALGHAITDVETGSVLSVKDGDIIRSRVISIQEGKKGRPGEIKGLFYDTSSPIGLLEKNTVNGIYGVIKDQSLFKGSIPLPMAYQHEIKEGAAYILTTLDDNQVKRYDIEILKVNRQGRPSGKGMIIRIVDEELIDKTGGIVQGMSGSPIIQNNKIVGAITHVLVNDPTRGYGIFIQWMVEESGIYDKN